MSIEEAETTLLEQMGRQFQLRAKNGGRELAPDVSIEDNGVEGTHVRRMTVRLGHNLQDLVAESEVDSLDNLNDSEQHNRKSKVNYSARTLQ